VPAGAVVALSGVATPAVTGPQVDGVPIRLNFLISPRAGASAVGHGSERSNGAAPLRPAGAIVADTPAVAQGNGTAGPPPAREGLAINAAQRKALALGMRYLNPEWSDEAIAQAAGVSRRTLFRWAEYNALKKAQRGVFNLPRGYKTAGGDMEAWADED